MVYDLKVPASERNTTVNKFMAPFALTIHPVNAVAATVAAGFATLIYLTAKSSSAVITETQPDGTVKIIGKKSELDNISDRFNASYKGFSTETQLNILFVIALIVVVAMFYYLVTKGKI